MMDEEQCQGLDPELEAMSEIIPKMERLNPDQRRRVCQWLNDRFSVHPGQVLGGLGQFMQRAEEVGRVQ